MPPPLELFIELEEKLASITRRRWDEALFHSLKDIKDAVDRDDFDAARERVLDIKFRPASDGQHNRMYALGKAMLSYGAQFRAGDTGAKWMRPSTDLTILDAAMNQLRQVEETAPKMACRMFDAFLRRQQDEARQLVLSKFDSTYAGFNVIRSGGKWSSDLSANLTTSRLVNYGALDSMNTNGVTRYQLRATLDRRTSHICRSLHGKTFDVPFSFEFLERALLAPDPESLRTLHPWVPNRAAVRGMSESDLVDHGWMVPPFHPRCRTIVVEVGSFQDEAHDEAVDIFNVIPYREAALAVAGGIGVAAAATLLAPALAEILIPARVAAPALLTDDRWAHLYAPLRIEDMIDELLPEQRN